MNVSRDSGKFLARDTQSVGANESGTSQARAEGGWPINAFGASPELLQRVIAAGLVVEEVNHQIAVILQDPGAGSVAFDADPLFAELLGERVVDFFGDSVELPATGPSGDQEEIEDGGQLAKVQKDYVLPAIVVSDSGCGQSDVQAPLARLVGGDAAGLWDGQDSLWM